MLAMFMKSALICFFAATAVAPLVAPPEPDTCRLRVENKGTMEAPSYEPTCTGGCTNGGTCGLSSTSGGGTTVWKCKCGADEVTTKCAGKMSLFGGVYTGICVRNSCIQQCYDPLTFPVAPGGPAYICTCPDA